MLKYSGEYPLDFGQPTMTLPLKTLLVLNSTRKLAHLTKEVTIREILLNISLEFAVTRIVACIEYGEHGRGQCSEDENDVEK